MLTFHLRLKRTSKRQHARLKFDLEKLNVPNVLKTFQAMICGKFASLTIMSNEDTDIDSVITTFNTAVTETASQTSDPWHTSSEEKTNKQTNKKQQQNGHCRNS